MYRQKIYNNKKLQLQITNSLIHCHDLACDCDDPTFHSTYLILQQLGKEFPENQRQKLKQCLGDTDTDVLGEPTGDDLGEDLEKLFAEDTEKDPTG